MCTCPNDSASWNASANSARYEPHLERDRNQPIVVTRCASLARLATAEPFRRPHRDVSYNVTLWQSVDLRFLWRVAKSPQCEERGGSRADQSSDTSASWITLAQSCVSAANSFAASALVLPIGSICSLLRMASAVAGSLTTSATSLLILSAIAAAVAGGATMAYQVTARKPASPASAMVGTSGRPGQRSGLPVAMMLTCLV